MADPLKDEDQDELEKMDEEDDEEEDVDLADPKKLKKKGLHIEGDDEPLHDADGTPILAPDPFAPHIEGEEDEDEELDIEDAYDDTDLL